MYKRIVFVFLFFALSLFSFLISGKEKQNIVSTMSVPVTNKIIAVDAGHGGEDGGAVSKNGISEADINLEIALKLQNLLEAGSAEVILTRSDENAIYDIDKKTLREKKVSDIKNRVKIINQSNADIFISIHLNKIDQSKYYGWQTFYKKGDENGKMLATSIQDNLNNSIQKDNKRVPHIIDNIYLMEHIKVPAVIVECGFLSNPQEEKELQNNEYQDRLAWGIYNGIMDYFK